MEQGVTQQATPHSPAGILASPSLQRCNTSHHHCGKVWHLSPGLGFRENLSLSAKQPEFLKILR